MLLGLGSIFKLYVATVPDLTGPGNEPMVSWTDGRYSLTTTLSSTGKTQVSYGKTQVSYGTQV